MRTRVIRVGLAAVAVALGAVGFLAAEPGLRTSQQADASTKWQLILGNEGAWCEGCCWALCCSLSAECKIPIE
jgi:hypothetical protein